MRLCLVRHAPAEVRDPARWPDDANRPLTQRGRTRFERAARGLQALGMDVDVLLSSGYRRAWDTAVILHEHARWPAPERLDAIIEAPAPVLLESLAGHLEGVATAAIVGHEPGLSELASLLVAGDAGGVMFDWRRGAVAVIDLEALEPGMGALEAFLPPRVLRNAARGTTAARG